MNLKEKYDTKKIILILIGVAFLSFMIAGVIHVRGDNSNGDKKFNYSKHQINSKKSYSYEGIDTIKVKSSSYDIDVKPSDEKNITVVLSGELVSGKKVEPPTLNVHKGENSINISVIRKKNDELFSIQRGDINIELFIPKEYIGDLHLRALSGDIEIEGVSLEELTIESSSGDIDISKANWNLNKIEQSSGDTVISKSVGEIDIESSSGDVELVLEELKGDIQAAVRSGDIDVQLMKEAGFKFVLETKSGDISTNMPISYDKDADKVTGSYGKSIDYKIYLNASSGDVDLDIN